MDPKNSAAKAQGLGITFLSRYRFSPSLGSTVGTALLLALFLFLGFWQLDRADQKRALQTKLDLRLHAKPMTLAGIANKKLNDIMLYPLTAEGHYVNQYTFLLDNKFHQGRAGYQVITAFIPDKPIKKSKLLLVNRGWVSLGYDRRKLPTIKPISGTQHIMGTIKIPVKPFSLTNKITDNMNNTTHHWPLRIQYIDLQQIAALIHKPVYPFIVLLDANQKGHYIRDWHFISSKAEKHQGYAVQWFAFALTLLIIYFAVNIKGLFTKQGLSAKRKSNHDP